MPPKPAESKRKKWFFGIPDILRGAMLGVLIGWAIQTTMPTPELVSWIGVSGVLFIRAIKYLVTPLVFCSLLTGMTDMLVVGKASAIGWRTELLYLTTSVIATIESLLWVPLFRSYFGDKVRETTVTVTKMAFVSHCKRLGRLHVRRHVRCQHRCELRRPPPSSQWT